LDIQVFECTVLYDLGEPLPQAVGGNLEGEELSAGREVVAGKSVPSEDDSFESQESMKETKRRGK
jgi:hypothetical protein